MRNGETATVDDDVKALECAGRRMRFLFGRAGEYCMIWHEDGKHSAGGCVAPGCANFDLIERIEE
jgi:hypothetical protein